MASDFSKPTVTSTKTGFPTEITENDKALARMFDAGESASNLPTNTKRIDQSDGQVYNWNGSAWVSLGFVQASATVPQPQRVVLNGCETTNSGANAIVVSGTLVLPAGKAWTWVRIVHCVYTNGATFTTPGKIKTTGGITIDGNDNTSNFGTCSVGNGVYLAASDTDVRTYLAEGVPSVTDQDITVEMVVDTRSAAPPATDVDAYIIGECI